MEADDIETLWARWLEGETLPEAEQRALAAALESDPELRRRLLDTRALDGMLRARTWIAGDNEAFVAATIGRLAARRKGARFGRSVLGLAAAAAAGALLVLGIQRLVPDQVPGPEP